VKLRVVKGCIILGVDAWSGKKEQLKSLQYYSWLNKGPGALHSNMVTFNTLRGFGSLMA